MQVTLTMVLNALLLQVVQGNDLYDQKYVNKGSNMIPYPSSNKEDSKVDCTATKELIKTSGRGYNEKPSDLEKNRANSADMTHTVKRNHSNLYPKNKKMQRMSAPVTSAERNGQKAIVSTKGQVLSGDAIATEKLCRTKNLTQNHKDLRIANKKKSSKIYVLEKVVKWLNYLVSVESAYNQKKAKLKALNGKNITHTKNCDNAMNIEESKEKTCRYNHNCINALGYQGEDQINREQETKAGIKPYEKSYNKMKLPKKDKDIRFTEAFLNSERAYTDLQKSEVESKIDKIANVNKDNLPESSEKVSKHAYQNRKTDMKESNNLLAQNVSNPNLSHLWEKQKNLNETMCVLRNKNTQTIDKMYVFGPNNGSWFDPAFLKKPNLGCTGKLDHQDIHTALSPKEMTNIKFLERAHCYIFDNISKEVVLLGTSVQAMQAREAQDYTLEKKLSEEDFSEEQTLKFLVRLLNSDYNLSRLMHLIHIKKLNACLLEGGLILLTILRIAILHKNIQNSTWQDVKMALKFFLNAKIRDYRLTYKEKPKNLPSCIVAGFKAEKAALFQLLKE